MEDFTRPTKCSSHDKWMLSECMSCTFSRNGFSKFDDADVPLSVSAGAIFSMLVDETLVAALPFCF